jgi:methionyl-tRNA formyltransferase
MGRKIRIVFMGTPEFAVASLKAICNENIEVAGVITAPDKPAGRGKKIQFSAVKQYALDHNIEPILQPNNLKDEVFIESLRKLNADLFIVVAFRMLPEAIWDMPELGTINLHASLLPQYRGAAPINWAIINGENSTGVTTFFIEKEIDTGNIIMQETVEITPDDNAGTLHDKLKIAGSELIIKTIHSIADGVYIATPQNNLALSDKLRPAPKIFKDDCKINWSQSTKKVLNFIRGLSPYPAAWTEIQGEGSKTLSLKIYDAKPVEEEAKTTPGDVVLSENSFKIACKNGYLSIKSLQQAGKKKMLIEDFLRGFNEKNNYKSAT